MITEPAAPTKGWKKLIEWIERGEIPDEEGIRELRGFGNASRERIAIRYLCQRAFCSRQSIQQWIDRRARPAGTRLDVVCEVTGASPSDWTEPVSGAAS